MLVSAPAAIAGGNALEKMKPEAKLRTKSQIVDEPVHFLRRAHDGL